MSFMLGLITEVPVTTTGLSSDFVIVFFFFIITITYIGNEKIITAINIPKTRSVATKFNIISLRSLNCFVVRGFFSLAIQLLYRLNVKYTTPRIEISKTDNEKDTCKFFICKKISSKLKKLSHYFIRLVRSVDWCR